MLNFDLMYYTNVFRVGRKDKLFNYVTILEMGTQIWIFTYSPELPLILICTKQICKSLFSSIREFPVTGDLIYWLRNPGKFILVRYLL